MNGEWIDENPTHSLAGLIGNVDILGLDVRVRVGVNFNKMFIFLKCKLRPIKDRP